MSLIRRWFAFGFCILAAAIHADAAPPTAAETLATTGGIRELVDAQAKGTITARELTRTYLGRIAKLDHAGPTIRSVIATDPQAESEAVSRDQAKVKGPLNGIPILIKDNIETAGALPTTAGSLALLDNVNNRDAPVVARLRAAGAVILGKTNLSEWANIRSSASTSGWSAVGGVTKNPHALDRSACGSSSGSGAAMAARFAAATIGTETDGSITCPAAVNGVVGLKPTVGLVPRTHIIPISVSQDTAGPITATVRDAAIILSVIAGSDPSDPKTAEADKHKVDYTAGLDIKSLQGARIGVLRYATGRHRPTDAVFDDSLETLRAAGAILIEIDTAPDLTVLWGAAEVILSTELKVDMNAYLSTVTPKVTTRSLADVIAFNRKTPAELRYFGQELFESADRRGTLASPEYLKARATAKSANRMLDTMLVKNKLDALIAPTTAPAWTIDLVDGDHFLGEASTLPAMAGYPHLTVPMGTVENLPVGLSFIGPAWSEAKLLALGYAFEQVSNARKAPAFAEHVANPADVGPAAR